jgi:citrate lyase beta subunit
LHIIAPQFALALDLHALASLTRNAGLASQACFSGEYMGSCRKEIITPAQIPSPREHFLPAKAKTIPGKNT